MMVKEHEYYYWSKVTSVIASSVVIGKSMWYLLTQFIFGVANGYYWPQPYLAAKDLPAMATDSPLMLNEIGSAGAGTDTMPMAPELIVASDPYALFATVQSILTIVAVLVIILWAIFLLYQSQRLTKKRSNWQLVLFWVTAVGAFISNFWLIGSFYFLSGACLSFAHQQQKTKGGTSDESDL